MGEQKKKKKQVTIDESLSSKYCWLEFNLIITGHRAKFDLIVALNQ